MQLQFKGDALFYGSAMLTPCRPAGVSYGQWEDLKDWVAAIPDGGTFDDLMSDEYSRGFGDGQEEGSKGGYDSGLADGKVEGRAEARKEFEEAAKTDSLQDRKRQRKV